MAEAPGHWPPRLQELCEVVGTEATLHIVRIWGGVTMYIPRRVDPVTRLYRELGAEAAKKLVARYAGDTLEIPTGAALTRLRRIEIEACLRSGLGVRRTARRCGVGRRYVKRVRARLEDGLLPAPLPGLFGDDLPRGV